MPWVRGGNRRQSARLPPAWPPAQLTPKVAMTVLPSWSCDEEFLEDQCRFVWRQSLVAQPPHRPLVRVYLLAFVQVKSTGELFDVHDLRQVGFRKLEDPERSFYGIIAAA